jgi:MFS family permease
LSDLPAPRRRLPLPIILLGLTSFMTDIASEMIFPLLPIFVVGLGATPTFLGLVEGVADAVSSFLKLASGWGADRVGRKKPLVVTGYAIASLVRPLMAFAMAPWHVLLIRSTDRVGKGIRTSPRDAMIADAVDGADAGRAFGFHRASDNAGAVVGALIATGLLAIGFEIREVFRLAIVPGALALIVLLAVRETPLARLTAAPAMTKPGAPPRLGFKVRSYLAVVTVFALSASSDAFLLLRAEDLGVKALLLPILWMVMNLCRVGWTMLGGYLADRVPRVRLMMLGWTISAGVYALLGFASAPWHVWVLFVVYGAYYGMVEPAERAILRDIVPPEIRGRAYGSFHFLQGLAAVPAGLLIGVLWHEFNAPVALITAASLSLVAVALLVWWSSKFTVDAVDEAPSVA